MSQPNRETATISVRIPRRLRERLEQLAGATGRTKSYLAAEALQAYIEREAWQIAAIQKGVEAAERGEFADDEEVKRRFARWGVEVEG
ncbi:MAG: ribbon-helix-helix protein, CopG family [Nitrococcus mobilis]|nr:ribbon-helix-helix protein, CopG family [Nitrococcus mobilis]